MTEQLFLRPIPYTRGGNQSPRLKGYVSRSLSAAQPLPLQCTLSLWKRKRRQGRVPTWTAKEGPIRWMASFMSTRWSTDITSGLQAAILYSAYFCK